jgi:hypothetical protein
MGIRKRTNHLRSCSIIKMASSMIRITANPIYHWRLIIIPFKFYY